jgi:glycosyltransferase involved in cell wall biosynthesis
VVRVLHVQKVKGIGGSERHLLSLLPGLAARGDDVAIVVLTPGAETQPFFDAAGAAGIETIRIPVGGDVDPRPIAGIGRAIARFRPDVVHTHLVHADLWGQLAARRVSTPAVRTAHNVQAFSRREPVRSAVRLSSRLARRTIAISEHVATFLRRYRLAPTDRIEVVPYGVDLGCYPIERPRRAATRARIGARDDAIVLGMAARMIDGKGHALAIRAVQRADELTDRSLVLALAGDGPLRSDLERAAGGDGAIRFLGRLDDVVPFLEGCDAMLFPTAPQLGEGFGLAALEGMAAQLPVLASAAGALPEIVLEGVTGRIVSGGVESWSRAIAELVSDAHGRAEMGSAARARAETFPVDRMVDATRAVYSEVVP